MMMAAIDASATKALLNNTNICVHYTAQHAKSMHTQYNMNYYIIHTNGVYMDAKRLQKSRLAQNKNGAGSRVYCWCIVEYTKCTNHTYLHTSMCSLIILICKWIGKDDAQNDGWMGCGVRLAFVSEQFLLIL